MSSKLFGIKTLANVGPELLGIQEDQKDAMQGRWYKDFKFPSYPTKTRDSSIKTKSRNKTKGSGQEAMQN